MAKFQINLDMSPQDISRYLASWVQTASQLSSGLHKNPNRLAPEKVEQFLKEGLDPILAYLFNTPEGKQHLTPPSDKTKSWQDLLNKQLQEILKTYQDAYLFVFQKNLEEHEQRISSAVANTECDPNDFRSMILGRQVQAPHVLEKLKKSKQLSDKTHEKAAHLLEEHIARLKDIDPLPPRASLQKILTKKPLFTGATAEKEYCYIRDTAALFMERAHGGKTRPSDLVQDAQTYLLAPMIAIAKDLKQRFDNNDDMELPPEAGDLPETEGITGHHMITGLDHYEFIKNSDNYQTSDNRPRFNLLKDLHQKYDSVLATTLPDSREELEEDLVTRLKTWVGTQQDFFATANNLVSKITKTQPDLIGKYFPQLSENQETLATGNETGNEEVPEANSMPAPPKEKKSETFFGRIGQRAKKCLNSAANFGRTLVNTMRPAAKTLATAATALVAALMSHHMGPSSVPTTPHTSKIIAATSSEAAHRPATTTTHEVAEPPAREAQIRPLVRKKTSAHLPLKAKFDSPQPLVIEGENMRFLESTYKKACTYFNRENVKTWVCELDIN